MAELLTKKKIENYCPLNKVKKQYPDGKRIVLGPLFTSYVFVRISDGDDVPLFKIAGVINLVYWLGMPAVIRDVEIYVKKSFG